MQAKSVYGQGSGAPGTSKTGRVKPQRNTSDIKKDRNKPKTKKKTVAAKTKDATEGVKDKDGSIGKGSGRRKSRSVLTQRVGYKEGGRDTTPSAEYR